MGAFSLLSKANNKKNKNCVSALISLFRFHHTSHYCLKKTPLCNILFKKAVF